MIEKQSGTHWRALRGLIATGLVVAGAASVVQVLVGHTLLFGFKPSAAVLLFVLGLGIYIWELRSSYVWAAARSILRNDGDFMAQAEEWRDAVPLIEFACPDGTLAPYPIAEWRDETGWIDFGMDVRRGLLLVSFPLEFLPGDFAEASALEFARSKAANEPHDPEDHTVKMGGESDTLFDFNGARRQVYKSRRDKGSQLDVLLRLRLRSGEEIEPPRPLMLNSTAAGAQPPSPVFLLICCFLFFGLVVEFLLVLHLADPVEWPVRKRFFSLPGGQLGALTFTCSSSGDIQVEGELAELRVRNSYWIGEDAKWKLLLSEVSQLGPSLITLRWVRFVGQFVAGVVTGAFLIWVLVPGNRGKHQFQLFVFGALAALVIWIFPCLVECRARHHIEVVSQKLGSMLPGGAVLTTSWRGGYACIDSDLSIMVEQVKPLCREEQPLRCESDHFSKPSLSQSDCMM